MKRIFQHRPTKSEQILVNEMSLYDEDSHFKYFRMTRQTFDNLLSKVGPELLHAPTHKLPISPKERLAMTLRTLATGDSHQTVSFSYRVGKTTVSNIVRETCQAIIAVLEDECIPTINESLWKKIAAGFEKNGTSPTVLEPLTESMSGFAAHLILAVITIIIKIIFHCAC